MKKESNLSGIYRERV